LAYNLAVPAISLKSHGGPFFFVIKLYFFFPRGSINQDMKEI